MILLPNITAISVFLSIIHRTCAGISRKYFGPKNVTSTHGNPASAFSGFRRWNSSAEVSEFPSNFANFRRISPLNSTNFAVPVLPAYRAPFVQQFLAKFDLFSPDSDPFLSAGHFSAVCIVWTASCIMVAAKKSVSAPNLTSNSISNLQSSVCYAQQLMNLRFLGRTQFIFQFSMHKVHCKHSKSNSEFYSCSSSDSSPRKSAKNTEPKSEFNDGAEWMLMSNSSILTEKIRGKHSKCSSDEAVNVNEFLLTLVFPPVRGHKSIKKPNFDVRPKSEFNVWCLILQFPQKKSVENINAKLALVMKSGKFVLGYKQTLKTLRQGKAMLVIIASNTPALRWDWEVDTESMESQNLGGGVINR